MKVLVSRHFIHGNPDSQPAPAPPPGLPPSAASAGTPVSARGSSTTAGRLYFFFRVLACLFRDCNSLKKCPLGVARSRKHPTKSWPRTKSWPQFSSYSFSLDFICFYRCRALSQMRTISFHISALSFAITSGGVYRWYSYGDGRFRPPDPASQSPVPGRRAEQSIRDLGPFETTRLLQEQSGSQDVSPRTTQPENVRQGEARDDSSDTFPCVLLTSRLWFRRMLRGSPLAMLSRVGAVAADHLPLNHP